MNKQLLTTVGFLLAITVAAAAAPSERVTSIFQATIGADVIQHVAVVGSSYRFEPNHIIVKVNVPVQLSVRREPGLVPHNMVIKAPEAGIDFDVELTSEARSITFTPNRTGTYPIYCSKQLLFFATHREKGMEGVLEVVE